MSVSAVSSALDEFSRLWSDGSRPSVEDFLAANPALAGDDEAVLGLVMAEVDYRAGAAENPSLDEYVRRFPALSDKLRRQWAYLRPDEVIQDEEATAAASERRRYEEPPRVPGVEVTHRIGRGGMGVVWLGTQTAFRRRVAVKVMKAGAHASEEELRRFKREAEAVGSARHPGVVQVFFFGEFEGTTYLVMEYVPGGTLTRVVEGSPDPRTAAALVTSAAEALGAAHAVGVVHRDVKPGNILIAEDGKPKVADFGLARVAADGDLTRTGVIVGTPAYMSPEQARCDAAALGPATDVWALGVILYEMLAGKKPFRGPDPLEILRQVEAFHPEEPAADGRTPEALVAICMKCLDKDHRRRYANGAELAAELRAYLEGRPVEAMRGRARRRRRNATAVAGGVAAVTLAAILTAYLALRPDDDTLALRRGEAVELIRAGKKLTWEWVAGKQHATETRSEDGCLQFGSSRGSMLVFRADPETDRFRYRVEFRQDRGGEEALVGPMVAVSRVPGEPEHLLTGLSAHINEFYRQNLLLGPDGSLRLSKIRHDPDARNTVGVSVFNDWGAVANGAYPQVGVARPIFGFVPREKGDSDWRSMTMEVSPREVVVIWDDRPDLRTVVPADRLEKDEAGYLKRHHGNFRWPAPPVFRFTPRGGVGLFIRQSAVSVRRVTIEPQPESPANPQE